MCASCVPRLSLGRGAQRGSDGFCTLRWAGWQGGPGKGQRTGSGVVGVGIPSAGDPQSPLVSCRRGWWENTLEQRERLGATADTRVSQLGGRRELGGVAREGPLPIWLFVHFSPSPVGGQQPT